MGNFLVARLTELLLEQAYAAYWTARVLIPIVTAGCVRVAKPADRDFRTAAFWMSPTSDGIQPIRAAAIGATIWLVVMLVLAVSIAIFRLVG